MWASIHRDTYWLVKDVGTPRMRLLHGHFGMESVPDPLILFFLPWVTGTRWPNNILSVALPIIIFLAEYLSIFSKASEFWVETELTVCTFETVNMPGFLHGKQIVAVDYLPSTAGTDRRLCLHTLGRVYHRHRLKWDNKKKELKTWNEPFAEKW